MVYFISNAMAVVNLEGMLKGQQEFQGVDLDSEGCLNWKDSAPDHSPDI